MASATQLVREALAGSGIEAIGSCSVEAYDARAPEAFRSAALAPGTKGVIVAGSAGPALWRGFRAAVEAEPERWEAAHPYDAFVAEILGRADRALAAAGVRFLRFEAAFHAPLRVNFVALARLAGLGDGGPFTLLIHPVYGPWWALRGAWLVDVDVDPPAAAAHPCVGCAAPCVEGAARGADSFLSATPEVRGRCVVGQAFRYDDDQIAYHHDRARTVARLRPRQKSAS